MKLPSKPIESAFISFSGDPSVGISSSQFKMEMYLDLNCISEPEQSLRDIRVLIQGMYSEMHGENCSVMFDFEVEEEEARLRKMEEEQERENAPRCCNGEVEPCNCPMH